MYIKHLETHLLTPKEIICGFNTLSRVPDKLHLLGVHPPSSVLVIADPAIKELDVIKNYSPPFKK